MEQVIIKQPKQSVWNNYKHKTKVENNKRKKRENTKESVYPVRSKLTEPGERAALRFTIMMNNFTKEISMSYKNKSPA